MVLTRLCGIDLTNNLDKTFGVNPASVVSILLSESKFKDVPVRPDDPNSIPLEFNNNIISGRIPVY